MVIQNGLKSHLLQLLADERAKKAPLQKQLDVIDARIAAIETTLAIYEESIPKSQKVPKGFTIEELRNNARTHKEALRFIAEHRNGGIVRYSEARDLIIAAGLSEGKSRNVGSHVYRLMHDSDEWEKVSPGVFRLIKTHKQEHLNLIQ